MGKKRKKKMKPKQVIRKHLREQKIKQEILDALGDIKEFEVVFTEEVTYSKTFKAKNKEELKEKFFDGELEFGNRYITDAEFCDGSLEIYEEGEL